MQPILASQMHNLPARHLPFNLEFWSEYHFETMNIHSFIVEAIGFGFGTRRIGLLLASYCRNVISASTTDAKHVEKEYADISVGS